MDNTINNIKIRKKRGRPEGFRLSEDSKERIRESRFGRRHSEETKDKISKSLVKYFKEKDPLSDTMRDDYKYFPKSIRRWILNNKEDIDKTENVMTEKKLLFLGKLELCLGSEIDDFSHNATPEFFVMLKEELTEQGLTNELEILHSLL